MHQAQLSADLERYMQKALELGASRAKIVRAEEIPVDDLSQLRMLLASAGAHDGDHSRYLGIDQAFAQYALPHHS